MSLHNRIKRIEGLLTPATVIDPTPRNNLAATKRRCEMLLGITDHAGERKGLQQIISDIEQGQYQPPAPLPKMMTDRAREMKARMVAAQDHFFHDLV